MPDPETSSTAQTDPDPPDWSRVDTDILCPLCSYNLRGLSEPRCPECGYRFEWPEVLDPRRRLHPYVFEHHPERNIRSFVRTAVGALRPARFWKTLHPIQPSNKRRLVTYLLVGQCLYLLALLTISVWTAYWTAQINNAAIAGYVSQITAQFKSMPPQQQQGLLQRYGSLQAYLSSRGFPPKQTTLQALRQQLSYPELPFLLVFVAGIPLMWPWLTFLALRVFAISMLRARVNKTHVFRCVAYSYDSALWAGLYGIAAVTAGFLSGGATFSTGDAIGLGLALVWFAGGIYGLLRLYAAYKHYLRFDHPFATVLSSQLIVGLVAANLFLFARLR